MPRTMKSEIKKTISILFLMPITGKIQNFNKSGVPNTVPKYSKITGIKNIIYSYTFLCHLESHSYITYISILDNVD